MYAGVCLLRARAFEALDSRARAIQWYKAALQADPFCQEAFSALVEHHMLSNEEELALVDGLQVAPEHGWLKLLYRCKCKKVRHVVPTLLGWMQSVRLAATGDACLELYSVIHCHTATLVPDCMPASMMLEL